MRRFKRNSRTWTAVQYGNKRIIRIRQERNRSVARFDVQRHSQYATKYSSMLVGNRKGARKENWASEGDLY